MKYLIGTLKGLGVILIIPGLLLLIFGVGVILTKTLPYSLMIVVLLIAASIALEVGWYD